MRLIRPLRVTLYLCSIALVAAAAYDAGQRSVPPIVLINSTPAPVAAPTPEPPGYWDKPLLLVESQGDSNPEPPIGQEMGRIRFTPEQMAELKRHIQTITRPSGPVPEGPSWSHPVTECERETNLKYQNSKLKHANIR